MNIEYGQGQVEITTKPVFGIAIADNAFTFKVRILLAALPLFLEERKSEAEAAEVVEGNVG